MHLTRAETSRQLPIPRKGTKYVARAAHSVNSSVPVVVAVRDMLKLARTSREVNELIKEKKIMLNGRVVRKLHESVQLFSVLTLDNMYSLSLLPTGRFTFVTVKDKTRTAKIIGKKMLGKATIQYNLHDGTNLLMKENANVGDSLVLDFENKVKNVLPLKKGASVFVYKGRRSGHAGKVTEIAARVTIKLEDDKTVELEKQSVMVR